MKKCLSLEVDKTTVDIADYRKDDLGKVINKFLINIDKIIMDTKAINSQYTTFVKTGLLMMNVEDRNAMTGSNVNTLATFATAALNLGDTSYKTTDYIFDGYSFSINIQEFLELRKFKTADPVYRLDIVDETSIELTLYSGTTYKFLYNNTYMKDNKEVDDLLEAARPIGDFVLLDSTYHHFIQSKKPSDVFSIYFDKISSSILVDDYYDELATPVSRDIVATLDICNKFLIGYRPAKKKGVYVYPDVEASIYEVQSPYTTNILKLIELVIYNDTHTIQQTFITL